MTRSRHWNNYVNAPAMLVAILTLVGCGAKGTQPAGSPTTFASSASPSSRSGLPLNRHGVMCRRWAMYSGPGQYSYSPRDVGASDAPKLSPGEVAELRRAESSTKSKTIRFAVLTMDGKKYFIIFDAVNGPCYDGAPGYRVINSNGVYYQPGENPFATHAVPGV